MASERQGGGETDAAELPPVPRKRDAAVAERDRLQLGNVGRRLAVPKRIGTWSLTSLRQRLMKTGGRLVNHAAVLLAAVGGRAPNTAAIRGDRAAAWDAVGGGWIASPSPLPTVRPVPEVEVVSEKSADGCGLPSVEGPKRHKRAFGGSAGRVP